MQCDGDWLARESLETQVVPVEFFCEQIYPEPEARIAAGLQLFARSSCAAGWTCDTMRCGAGTGGEAL